MRAELGIFVGGGDSQELMEMENFLGLRVLYVPGPKILLRHLKINQIVLLFVEV